MNLKFLILLSITFCLIAEEIEILSNTFEADEKRLVSIFKGDVKVKKGKDKIDAKKLIVYFDKNKKPIRYEALGDVIFRVVLDLNRSYEGKAQKIIYIPKKKEYIFEKDVFIVQKPQMRKIYGQKVIINKSTNQAFVEGKKDKPVKFIFKVEENSTKASE